MRRTVRLHRTAFGMYRPKDQLTEARTPTERQRLAVAHATFVEGRTPEFYLQFRKDQAKAPAERHHATKFVFPRAPIQIRADRDVSHQVATELNSNGAPATAGLPSIDAPTRYQRSLPPDLSKGFEAAKASALSMLDRAKEASHASAGRRGSSSSDAYFLAAVEVGMSRGFGVRPTEIQCRRVAALLTGDEELCKKHSAFMFRALPLPGSKAANGAEWVVQGQFDSRFSGLERVFGALHWKVFRQWIGHIASSAESSFDRQRVVSIRLPWVQESIRSVVWQTGVEVRSEAQKHSPRNDVRTTSQLQAKQTVDVMVSLLAELLHHQSWQIDIECDSAFMFVVMTPQSPPSEATRSTPPSVTGTALSTRKPDANAVDVFDPRRLTPLVTVDAVLEKRGLPHDFVSGHIETALQLARDVDVVASYTGVASSSSAVTEGDSARAPAHLTVKSVIDAAGIAYQRVRIQNTTLRHVQALCEQLQSGFFGVPGVNEPVDDYLASCRLAASTSGTAWVTPPANCPSHQVRVRFHWAPNAELQHARKNGFVRLTKKERGRTQGFQDRRTGKVQSMRDDERFTEEDFEIAKERRFTLHSPTVCADGEGPLRIGDDLYGYEHRTTVTNILADDRAALEDSLTRLRSDGFVNYFGRQRFSALSSKGVLPGLHLLRGEFRAAAHALVDVGEHHDFGSMDVNDEVRFNATTRRLIALLQSTADGGSSESGCRDAFVHGLGPRVMKGLIAEAMSFLWNAIATARVNQAGCFKLVEGDIVRPRAEAAAARDGALLTFDIPEPIFVTSEDIAARRYSVHDLVLPIPGAGVVLPRNDMAGVIIKTMDAQGVHLHPERRVWPIFSAAHNPVGMDMLGGYRHFIERPQSLKWSWNRDDADAAPAAARSKLRAAGAGWARSQDLQLELRYRLPASAYRWSMLRELCKANDFCPDDLPEVVPPVETSTKSLTPKDRALHAVLNKKKDTHHGTERMAMAKIQASIFKSGGTYGLVPTKFITGRGGN